MKFSDLNKLGRPLPARTPAEPAPEAEAGAQFHGGFPLDEDSTAAASTGPAAGTGPSDTVGTKPAPATPEVPFRELDAQARKVYTRLLARAAELLNRTNQSYTEQYKTVMSACLQTAETLKTNPVLLNYASYSTSGDYLPGHTANTTLLALALGRATGLEGSELDFLGFCAMAHDIGMTGFKDLYNLETRLSKEEFSEITLHVEEGAQKIDRIVDLDYKLKDRVKRVILNVHERLDGSGYPDGLSAEKIDPLAQLIGIADVYEALTHPRAWREALNPPDAIKELIEKEGKGFNVKTIKALIAALSIYPPGSIVALSTKEIARVIKVNKSSLTRPLVEIILNANFSEIAPQTLELFKHPLTSIERPVSLHKIQERNPALAAKLELARWWTE